MMRKERRIRRRIDEIRACVTADGVVAADVGAHFALGEFAAEDGLEGRDGGVVFDEGCDDGVAGFGRGLQGDVAGEAARVVA